MNKKKNSSFLSYSFFGLFLFVGLILFGILPESRADAIRSAGFNCQNNFVYLPSLTKKLYRSTWESEPNNNSKEQADGPLLSGLVYKGYPNDQYDIFFFEMNTTGLITIDLEEITGQGVQLFLFVQGDTVPRAIKKETPYHIQYSGRSQIYYIAIFTESGHNDTVPYELKITYPSQPIITPMPTPTCSVTATATPIATATATPNPDKLQAVALNIEQGSQIFRMRVTNTSNVVCKFPFTSFSWGIVDNLGNNYSLERSPAADPNMFDTPLSIKIPPNSTAEERMVIDERIAWEASSLTFVVDDIWCSDFPQNELIWQQTLP